MTCFSKLLRVNCGSWNLFFFNSWMQHLGALGHNANIKPTGLFTSHQMPPKPSPGSSLSNHYSARPRASLLRSSSSAPGSLAMVISQFLFLRRAPCPWRGREPWWRGGWGCRRRQHLSRLPQGFQSQLSPPETFEKPAQSTGSWLSNFFCNSVISYSF